MNRPSRRFLPFLAGGLLLSCVAGVAFPAGAQTTAAWSATGTSNWSVGTNWSPNGAPGSDGAATLDTANLINLGATAATVVTYDAGASGYIGTLNFYNTSGTNGTTLLLNRDLTINTALTMYQTGTSATASLTLNGHNLTIASGAIMTLGGTTVTNPTIHSNLSTTAAGSTIFLNGTLLLSEGSSSTAGTFTPGLGAVGTSPISIAVGNGGVIDIDSESSTLGTRLTVTGNFSTTGTNTIESTVGGTGVTTGNSIYLSGITNTIGSGTTFTGFTSSGMLTLAPGSSLTQTTSTGILLPAFQVRDTNSGTAGSPVTTREVFSSSASSGTASNLVNTTTLYNSGTNATLVFALGSNLSLASGSAPFSFIWAATPTGDTTNIDLNGFSFDTTTSAASFSPSGTTTGVTTVNLINSGASSIGGGNGIFKAGSFNLSLADIGIGNGVILQATTVGATSTLSGISGGSTTINAGSTFYYDGAGTASLISTRAIGNIVVGDGTTAALLMITGSGSPLVSKGVTTVNANGTLDLHGTNGALVTTGLSGSGTVTNNTGSSQTSSLTIDATGTNTFSGVVKDNSIALNVILGSGFTGTQVFSNAANSYVGSTTIDGGTLSVSKLANGGAVSGIGKSSNAATNLVLDGGTFQYTGAAASTDRLFSVGASGGTLDASGTGAVNYTNTGAMGFNGETGARAVTLTGTNTGLNTVSAAIGDNTGATSLVKSGAGTWRLAGTNTYTGSTTVTGGLLLVTGTSVGGGAFTVASGGALGGAGGTITASGVTVASGGGLNISGGGAVSPGALTLALGSGSLDLSAAAGAGTGELNFTLGTASDKVVLSSATSTINIGAGLLSLADFTLNAGSGFGAGTYILFDTASASGLAGVLASGGLTGTLDGFTTTLSLSTDGSGDADIVLNVVAVPEPSLLLLLFLGLAVLVLRRRVSATA